MKQQLKIEKKIFILIFSERSTSTCRRRTCGWQTNKGH